MTIDPASPTPPRRLLRGAQQLADLVGQRLLIGLTYVNPAGEVLSTLQMCGRVLAVEDGVVVVTNPTGEEPIVLPADAAAYTPAEPGQYTLKDSGAVIVDPDYLTTWRIVVQD